jgi:nucleotide-binding universal stress UspA family protein
MRGQVITVGADGSRASRRAFAWALQEASGRDRVVQVVTAYKRLPGQGEDAARAAAEKTAHDTMGDAESDEPGGHDHATSVSLHFVQGDPVDVLVRESAHSALLVMGSHSVDTIRHNMLGSVTDTCARMSECPVVVVGPGQRAGRVEPAMDGASATDVVNRARLDQGRWTLVE